MSFSDFKTLSQVQQAYQIHYQESLFIPKQKAILSPVFVEDLTFNINQLDVFSSEAARCELIILPVLRFTHAHAAGFHDAQKIIADHEIAHDTD